MLNFQHVYAFWKYLHCWKETNNDLLSGCRHSISTGCQWKFSPSFTTTPTHLAWLWCRVIVGCNCSLRWTMSVVVEEDAKGFLCQCTWRNRRPEKSTFHHHHYTLGFVITLFLGSTLPWTSITLLMRFSKAWPDKPMHPTVQASHSANRAVLFGEV